MTTDVPPVSIDESARIAAAVLDRVAVAIVGKDEAARLVLAGILARGHVLLEDVPGVGKTLMARSFAQALGIGFRRVQFTPDLLPSDVTGSFVFDQRTSEFVFRAGPVFTGLLLADEINRTPPKTQAALLEAMQERQVTVEGTTFPLAEPFHVVATANPVEYEGTYPLPEAQLDRFVLRVPFGYPTAEEEWDVLARRIDRRREEQSVEPATDASGLVALQHACETVTVDPSVGRYCVELAAETAPPPPSPDRRITAGFARPVADGTIPRVDRRARLRGARGRQGRRRRRAGASHHRSPRAVAARRGRRLHHP